MKKISKIVLVLGAILISTTLVTAALLTYSGKVNTTMTAQQSVVISDGHGWKNWDEPITRNLGNVVHCTDYCYKLWIKNQACKPADVTLTDVCTAAPYGDPAGIDIAHYIFGDSQTIELRQKDPVTWLVINSGTVGADITFNTCGTTFDYSINYWGLTGDYSLVYYIDQEDRFVNWGKVFDIADLSFYGSSTITGSADIPTMPYVDDYNSNHPVPDAYDHHFGAKLWLVPTSNLNAEHNHLISWTPTAYLFETDLGFYMDCDNMNPVCLPYVYPIFDTHVLQANSEYCWISCYHVAFNIMGGNYAFETTVTATEHV